MTALSIVVILCLMLAGFIVAVGLTIWLIVDIVKEKREEKEDGKS